MYTFNDSLDKNIFDAFVAERGFAPIQQTSAWAGVKSSWKGIYCGLYRDGDLVGAALVLIRRLLPGFSCAYCPRGPVMDFSDKDAVFAFASGMKTLCKKYGAYAVTIDPLICVGLTLPDMAEGAYTNPYDTEAAKTAFENITASGFTHMGFGKDLHSALQPRYNAMIPLKNRDGAPLTADGIKKNYRPKIRKYFGSFRTARGLYFEKAEPTEENLRLFVSILKSTEARQNITLRDENYFRLIADGFGENACFAFEKCDVKAYIAGLEQRFAKEPENAETLSAQLDEAKKILAEKGEKFTLSAILTVYPPNKTGVRVAEYLYAGSDLSTFPAFRATLCALYEQCIICTEKNCDFLNLGGFAGTFDDGLFEFKNQFNPLCTEYAGEFDLVAKPFSYKLMTKALPSLRKLYGKLRGKK